MPLDSDRTDSIPVIDLGPCFAGEPGALEATAADLHRICETVGFLFIRNHGVPVDLMRETFAAAAAFHALPLEEKMALKLDDRMQGYLPYKSSVARANGLNAVRKPNENEAFFVNPERDPAHPVNRWPDSLPSFREVTLRYYAAVEALALRMLPIYARALDLPADYFGPLCDRSLSSLRLTHYPPVEYGADEFGIAPHTDSSFITLLAQNPVPGLQIRTQAGEWIDAPVLPDTFVVNTGDVLNRWTNGRFLSTPHRAFNKEPKPRYAIPFFFHPNPETLIEALPGCTDAANPPKFPPQTVGDYMAAFRGANYDHFRQKKGEAAPAS
ncbi:isopenicillin N synthase family dioxygenase [Pararoseomonas indoligenes]|uniref:2-oxoglutarate-dependent ethylene/succinate-forming enzyme n=1 Tax=Roseomonas indoligenes TaxID=2820811 RepID=A0A940N1N6_9PROT|nr:isopenicillin N synthase family oxygenase [Pararoseomonas indoligenes]MBP0494401.1 isopenicillin N synthase family oxygenase [Pararoseomonas indoligenes]